MGKSQYGGTLTLQHRYGQTNMGLGIRYITILHRKDNVRSKTFSCFVPCASIPEDSIPGVPTYPYPPPACLKADSNYDATIHPKDTNIQWVVGSCRSQICHVLRLRFRIFEVFSDDKNNFLI